MKKDKPKEEWVAPVINILEWAARRRHPAGKGLTGEANSSKA
jgi:hypothetical protein